MSDKLMPNSFIQKLSGHVKYRKEQLLRLQQRINNHLYIKSNVKHLYGVKKIPRHPSDCILVSVIRDCEDYIETFIEHHLSLGIKHIVLLDNGSTDQTLAIAGKYAQVTLLSCLLPFAQYKREMRQFLIDQYSWNHWCLLIDGDELFDYPYSQKLPLPKLLQWLDSHQYDAVIAQMLDMFPQAGIQSRQQDDQKNFRQVQRWFEISHIEKKSLPSGLSHKIPPGSDLKLHYGGVRNRVFNNYPFLSKFALLKPNFRLQLVGSHLVQWARIADINCVLFHYKFLPKFGELVEKAIQEKQYYNDSSEYKRYQEVLKKKADLSLYSEHSIEYHNTDQLLELGFLKVSDDYRQYSQSFQDVSS